MIDNMVSDSICPNCKKPLARLSDAIETMQPACSCQPDLTNLQSFPNERYQPILRLGFGSAASVYKCIDKMLNRTVAVKTLNRVSGNQVIDFQREARALSTLKHEAIVRVLDFGVTASGAPYLVMDFVQGETLAERLAKCGRLPVSTALEVITTVGEALAHAHDKGIFHRDIKPSNILISEDGDNRSVKIVDFGIAQIERKIGDPTIEQGRTIVGTPFYMSPDQLRGETYDAASEVYSLSCILFETLTGQVPFEGDSPLELLSQHASIPPPSLRAFGDLDALSPELETIIKTGLAKSKENRFRSMPEFIESLRALSGEQLGAAHATSSNTTSETELRSVNRRYAIAFIVGILAVVTVIPLVAINVLTQTETAQAPRKKLSLPTDVGSLNVFADNMNKQIISFSEKGCRVHGVDGPMDTEKFRQAIKGRTIKRLIIMGVYPTPNDAEIFNSLNLDRLELLESQCSPEVMKILSQSNLTVLIIKYTMISDEAIESIGHMKSLHVLDLTKTSVTDKGLSYLANAKNLVDLRFASSEYATGEGLAGLQHLRCLDVGNTNITREALMAICALPELQTLKISPTNLTDDDLRFLANTNLTGLRVSGNNITRAGLEELRKVRHLGRIEFNDMPKVTESDITRFRRERPDVSVLVRGRERD